MASQSVGVQIILNPCCADDNMIDFVIIGLDIAQRLVKSEFM